MFIKNKAVVRVTTWAEFYDRAKPAAKNVPGRTFVVTDDLLNPGGIGALSEILPCTIIGEPKVGTCELPILQGVNFKHDALTRRVYNIKNMRLQSTLAKLTKKEDMLRMENVHFIPSGVSGTWTSGLQFDSNGTSERPIVIIDGFVLEMNNDESNFGILLRDCEFHITGGTIYRADNGGSKEEPAIRCIDNSYGTIERVAVEEDAYDTSDAWAIDIQSGITGAAEDTKSIVVRDFDASQSRYALYLYSGSRLEGLGKRVLVGNNLKAQGVKVVGDILEHLECFQNMYNDDAIYLSYGSTLRDCMIRSQATTGLVRASLDDEVIGCDIRVASGKVGVRVDNSGTPGGRTCYNHCSDTGTHLDINAAISDYIAQFNSTIIINNPKASCTNNT